MKKKFYKETGNMTVNGFEVNLYETNMLGDLDISTVIFSHSSWNCLILLIQVTLEMSLEFGFAFVFLLHETNLTRDRKYFKQIS